MSDRKKKSAPERNTTNGQGAKHRQVKPAMSKKYPHPGDEVNSDSGFSGPIPPRYLVDEYPLFVLPSLAMAIGLREAMVIQKIHMWMKVSKHDLDGRKWIYNTYDQWHDQFPFFSVATLKRIIRKLEKMGIIISTSRFNKLGMDRTKWYTIDYGAMPEECNNFNQDPKSNNDRIKMTLWSDQIDPMHEIKMTPPIPIHTQYNSTTTTANEPVDEPNVTSEPKCSSFLDNCFPLTTGKSAENLANEVMEFMISRGNEIGSPKAYVSTLIRLAKDGKLVVPDGYTTEKNREDVETERMKREKERRAKEVEKEKILLQERIAQERMLSLFGGLALSEQDKYISRVKEEFGTGAEEIPSFLIRVRAAQMAEIRRSSTK